jgi:ferredoxin
MAGPHGMHNVNSQSFAANHKDFVEQKGIGSCKACHGLLLEGTYLSKVPVARSFTHDTKTVNIASGTKVSCDLCHTNPLNRYP